MDSAVHQCMHFRVYIKDKTNLYIKCIDSIKYLLYEYLQQKIYAQTLNIKIDIVNYKNASPFPAVICINLMNISLDYALKNHLNENPFI